MKFCALHYFAALAVNTFAPLKQRLGDLVLLGCEVTALHLLESPKLAQPITEFIDGRNPGVKKTPWLRDTVRVDKPQTTGFRGVREPVWNFHIGGYQVCEKWLKDRKGRTLTKGRPRPLPKNRRHPLRNHPADGGDRRRDREGRRVAAEMKLEPKNSLDLARKSAETIRRKTRLNAVANILAAKQKNPAADTSALVREIVPLVYVLYGLTPKAITIAEGAAK